MFASVFHFQFATLNAMGHLMLGPAPGAFCFLVARDPAMMHSVHHKWMLFALHPMLRKLIIISQHHFNAWLASCRLLLDEFSLLGRLRCPATHTHIFIALCSESWGSACNSALCSYFVHHRNYYITMGKVGWNQEKPLLEGRSAHSDNQSGDEEHW